MRAVGDTICDVERDFAALSHPVNRDPELRSQVLIVNMKQDAVLPIGVDGCLSHGSSPEPGDDYSSVSNWSPAFVHYLTVYGVAVFHVMCCIGERNEPRCQHGECVATNQYPAVQ